MPQQNPTTDQRTVKNCGSQAMSSMDTKLKSKMENVIRLDSGASHYMIWNKEWLRNPRQISPPNRTLLGDGNKVLALHRVTLFLSTIVQICSELIKRHVVFDHILYVLELHSNLISRAQLCKNDYVINFGLNVSNGMNQGLLQLQGKRFEGVYRSIGEPLFHGTNYSCLAAVSRLNKDNENEVEGGSNLNLWNVRLGHVNLGSIKKLVRSGAASGLNLGARRNVTPCTSCVKGKQTRQSLRRNDKGSQERSAVIHTDKCGPMSVAYFSGERFFVSLVDEYSGYISIIPILRKSYVLLHFRMYQAWIERKYECSIKRVHSDNGVEVISMRDFMSEKGIEQSRSPPYSPNLNCIAKRANRTIVECARSMIDHASLPKHFWAEAVVHVARIRSVFFCPRRYYNTSYELLTGQVPDVAYLRVFGCMGWYHVPKKLRKKLDAKSEMGIVIGCLENSQYKLWIPSRNVAVISRDVTIAEGSFPGHELFEGSSDPAPILFDDREKDGIEKTTIGHTTPTVSGIQARAENSPSPTIIFDGEKHARSDIANKTTLEQVEALTYRP